MATIGRLIIVPVVSGNESGVHAAYLLGPLI
jgi:hypothetical protein